MCLALAFPVIMLASCSGGEHQQECADGGVLVDGNCYPRDCPNRDCPSGFVCVDGFCHEIACFGVDCPEEEECAGGDCYPSDCETRNCPGLGEVCIDDECLPTSCVSVECPEGELCAAGNCYPIDCETKKCPGYGEVCVDDECIERTCVGVHCDEGETCAGGYCYPSDCTQTECFGEGEVCIDGVCQRRNCVNVECQPGFACANGWCYPEDCDDHECLEGEICYEDSCIPADCLGVVCPEGERCARGECFPIACGGDVCEENEVCYEDRCVGWLCVGVQCPPDHRCQQGVCVAVECPEECTLLNQCSRADCSGAMFTCLYDYQSETPAWMEFGDFCFDGDPCTVDDTCEQDTCAGSGMQCTDPPGKECDGDTLLVYPDEGYCDDGQCYYVPERIECTNGCDVDHCVGDPCAGVNCDAGEECVDGECRCGGTGPDCPPELACCGTECVDLQENPLHCGECGRDCESPFTQSSCVDGRCHIDSCTSPWTDCNGLATDGCESPLPPGAGCGAWLTSGGSSVGSQNYRLEVFIAPVGPVGDSRSTAHHFRLGPAVVRAPR